MRREIVLLAVGAYSAVLRAERNLENKKLHLTRTLKMLHADELSVYAQLTEGKE